MALDNISEPDPVSPAAENDRGIALAEQGKLVDAEACYLRALALTPDFGDAWNNLGNALLDQGRMDESLASLERARQLMPGNAAVYNNLGRARWKQGQLDDAVAHFQLAVRLRPDFAKAHSSLGIIRLLQGRWEEGWAEYEWRWKIPELLRRPLRGKLWDGVPLTGRSVLLYPEQGFGDTLQFIRYAALVKQQGMSVMAACHKSLLPLVSRVPGVDRAEAEGRMRVPVLRAPLLSLPRLFGTTLETIPANVPYLFADPALVEQWGRQTAPLAGFKVGIIWQGDPGHPGDRERSVPLAAFAPLARIPGVRLVSLQAGTGVEQLANAEFAVSELSGARPWPETAAVMMNLDLVISVDTAPAHLAGGLGVPVWVLLPYVPDWRWLLGREDSPWYPTMRLFRQERPGEWAGVFARVKEELERIARDKAIAGYHRALELNPDSARAHNNLGLVLLSQGRLAEASVNFRKAAEIEPDFATAYNNLGLVLVSEHRLEEASTNFCKAAQLDPDFAAAHSNLAKALRSRGLLDEALEACRRTLELRPDFAWGHADLGNLFKDRGELPEAITCYRRALELRPNDAAVHSDLLHTLRYSPESNSASIHEELCRWNQQHAEPLARSIEPHTNDRSPERRLRIAYVSPDFRLHSVGRFICPLLHAHDRRCVEVFCYASVQDRDGFTERCRGQADVWRDVLGLSDEDLAGMIRQDRIDILVDLAMHTAGNRLLVFARKPAPVQVAYLAYCGSTGLATMDYRLTDPYLDPPGQDDDWYPEQSIRLPRTYWCYQPLVEAPAAVPPPREAGAVVFGCLNNFCKVTPPTLEAWRRLLQALPKARLLVHAHAGSHRDRVRAYFADGSVDPGRLTFVPLVSWPEYFRTYQGIDIALDPFPCGGGTTTCDALWMGVPVVSLHGRTAVGRAGLSILSNVGLPELVAADTQEYVRIATELAGDIPRLHALRATLPDRMRSSPLMDVPAFARDVESAFRTMWGRWCAFPSVTGGGLA